ncbi:hypothetical protein PMAYCL1PPCAC_06223, partial [Pristionchus mayeri]
YADGNVAITVIIDVTHWLTIVLFVISVVLNGILIYAIVRHSSIHTGKYYKSMQTGLACSNIIVVGIIMLVRPAIHLHGGVFFLGGHLRFFPFSFAFAVLLIYGYQAIFIQKTIAMGTVMVFRMWTMSRRFSSLPSYYLLFIPLIAFSIAIPPTVFHMVLIFPSDDTQNICLVRDSRGICTETIGQAIRRHLAPNSGFLVSPLQLGDWHNYPLTISLILMLVLMIGTLVVVLAGAVWIMKQAGESHDIKLHRQLARALLCQILVPAALMQIPMTVGIIGFLLHAKMDLLLMCMPIINS